MTLREGRHRRNYRLSDKILTETHLDMHLIYVGNNLEKPEQLAQRTIDRLWNAFGYALSPDFDEDGKFRWVTE